jgi:glycosyltransferase involved in cell wall biosynthesis
MDVTVTSEARYLVSPDGAVWSQVGFARNFWERYLEVFDKVRIVGRAVPVKQPPEGWMPVNSRDIVLCALPGYLGPLQYARQYPAIRAAIGSAAPARGAVILRVASQISNMLEPLLRRKGQPYALEVVGDPYDLFAPGAVQHTFRPYFRWHFARHLRWQCLHASAVAYVTKRALQQRYPAQSASVNIADIDLPSDAAPGRPVTTHYSSVELPSTSILERARQPKSQGPWQIVTVGTLAQNYKGIEVLIEAIARCIRAGVDLRATIVGDGQYRLDLVAQAERAGASDRIHFAGQVTSGEPVRQILDKADLFVLPSRQEGLPRAMIEAMARGLPCVGSAVGGIPELLEPPELVPVGDSVLLAARIQEVLSNPMRMEEMSRRNLAVAREYCESILSLRRKRFYEHVRRHAQTWELRRKMLSNGAEGV